MVDELEQFRKDLLDSVLQMKSAKASRVTEEPFSANAVALAEAGVSQIAFVKPCPAISDKS